MYQPLNVMFIPGDAGIDFSLSTGSRIDRFRISLEALRDHFGADDADTAEETLKCFYAHDQDICAVAFKKTDSKQSCDRILISSMDF
jgi:hypothetical protein